MIKRAQEIQILAGLKNNPAVALLGPRQVGKTTLAKHIELIKKEKSVYLDLENPRDIRKLDDAYSFFERNKDKHVIIDEVQVLPHLFKVLRPAIDSHRKAGRFLLLGSASPSLIKGVSEYLAGRIAFIELTPFNLLELKSKSINQETLWMKGGFPLSLLTKKLSDSLDWRSNFVKSYIQTELARLFHVNLTPIVLQNFWQMLAHFNGGIWNANTFASSLGVTAPTVRRYLDYMEGAFLVRRLYAWYANAKKRLVKSPKIFLRDSGILHSLLNIDEPNELYGHPGAGNSWEGFTIEQIVTFLPSNLSAYYYRTHHGAEADLVLVKGIKPLTAIEIKLSNSPAISKGFYECVSDLKTQKNFIITPNSDDYLTKEKIHVCSLISFLKNHLPTIVKQK